MIKDLYTLNSSSASRTGTYQGKQIIENLEEEQEETNQSSEDLDQQKELAEATVRYQFENTLHSYEYVFYSPFVKYSAYFPCCRRVLYKCKLFEEARDKLS